MRQSHAQFLSTVGRIPSIRCTLYGANCTSYSLEAKSSEENSSPHVSNTSTREMLRPPFLVFRARSEAEEREAPFSKDSSVHEFAWIVHAKKKDGQKNLGRLVQIVDRKILADQENSGTPKTLMDFA
jgi:hypothetical protein